MGLRTMWLQTQVFAAELYLLFMADNYTILIQSHNDRGLWNTFTLH